MKKSTLTAAGAGLALLSVLTAVLLAGSPFAPATGPAADPADRTRGGADAENGGLYSPEGPDGPEAAASRTEAERFEELLAEGHELFHRASNLEEKNAAQRLYRHALYRFESVVDQGGVRNGALYYNIANTYYRLGDLGRAVLNYRRAQLFSPGDPNLRHNLRYVRSQRTDQIPPDQVTSTVRALFFWHYLLPPAAKLLLFAGLLVGFSVFTSLYIFRRFSAGSEDLAGTAGHAGMKRAGTAMPAATQSTTGTSRSAGAQHRITFSSRLFGSHFAGRLLDRIFPEKLAAEWSQAARITIAAWGGVLLLVAGSLAVDEVRLRTMRDGVILSEVVARKGDGIAYQPSFVDPLHPGTEFRLVEARAGWYRIRLADGRTCWIPSRASELVLAEVRPDRFPVAVRE